MGIGLNPYIAGIPVDNTAAFVGREDIVQEVVRMLSNQGQNVVTLYGQRRIGKTSLLQYLISRLPKENAFQPIFFDLEDKATRPLADVLMELAQTIALHLNLPRPDLGIDIENGFCNNWLPGVIAGLPTHTALVLLLNGGVCAGERERLLPRISLTRTRNRSLFERAWEVSLSYI